METPKNNFKQALLDKQPQYGLWLGLADPYSAEICAGANFHWLLIDAEHAPNDPYRVLTQLQAIAPYSTHPIVRPIEGNAANIKQLLDLGAQTLLIPMVESATQAQDLVDACTYPPRGIRGVGSALARGARWNRFTDYFETADDEVCLLLQIESDKGLEALHEIVKVKGVDGIFIGPADLAASLGHLGNAAHPEVQKAIEKAIKIIIDAGKAPGIMATEPERVTHYRNCGALFFAVGIDTQLLVKGSSDLLNTYKN